MNSAPSDLRNYFSTKLREHGPTACGVDWNSEQRQKICFRQLIRIMENPVEGRQNRAPSILDYGCGYGALAGWLSAENVAFSRYQGYDFTPAMIEQASHLFGGLANVSFTDRQPDVRSADFVIGCGLLALKLEADTAAWEKYVYSLIEQLWSLALRGLAFNSLTSYSDTDRMRPDLYYPDPGRLFAFCKQKLSRNVALLHDYGAYEFTILVRRNEEVAW